MFALHQLRLIPSDWLICWELQSQSEKANMVATRKPQHNDTSWISECAELCQGQWFQHSLMDWFKNVQSISKWSPSDTSTTAVWPCPSGIDMVQKQNQSSEMKPDTGWYCSMCSHGMRFCFIFCPKSSRSHISQGEYINVEPWNSMKFLLVPVGLAILNS